MQRLETEVKTARRYFSSLTTGQVETVCAVEEARQRGESLDRFSAADLAEYEEVARITGQFSEAALAELRNYELS